MVGSDIHASSIFKFLDKACILSKLTLLLITTALSIIFSNNVVSLLLIHANNLLLLFGYLISKKYEDHARMFLKLYLIVMVAFPASQMLYYGNIIEGFLQGVRAGLILLNIIMVSSLVFLSTSPIDILCIVSKLRPINPITFLSALRFLPEVLQDIETVMKVLKARGLNVDNPICKLQHMGSALAAVLVAELRKANKLALGFMLRGFDGEMELTCPYDLLKLSKSDLIIIMDVCIITVILTAIAISSAPPLG